MIWFNFIMSFAYLSDNDARYTVGNVSAKGDKRLQIAPVSCGTLLPYGQSGQEKAFAGSNLLAQADIENESLPVHAGPCLEKSSLPPAVALGQQCAKIQFPTWPIHIDVTRIAREAVGIFRRRAGGQQITERRNDVGFRIIAPKEPRPQRLLLSASGGWE